MTFQPRLLILCLLPAALIAASIAVAAFRKPASQRETNPTPVTVTQAQARDSYTLPRRIPARAEAGRSIRASFELDGKLAELSADLGDTIREGEVLARLDTALLRSQRQELSAQLTSAEAVLSELVNGARQEQIAAARAERDALSARLELATRTNARIAKLAQTNVETNQRRDETSFTAAELESSLAAANARLEELKNGPRQERISAQRAEVDRLSAAIGTIDVQLDQSVLRAPFDAIVTERHVDEGAIISMGAPVLSLRETGVIELRAGLSPRLARSLKIGDSVDLELPGGGLSTAIVAGSAAYQNSQSRTVAFRFHSEADLLPGELVYLIVEETYREPVLEVPRSALTESLRGMWSVFALDSRETNRLVRHQLETIAARDDMVFVRGSLQNGDLIVSEGTHKLTAGMHVTAVNEIGGAP